MTVLSGEGRQGKQAGKGDKVGDGTVSSRRGRGGEVREGECWGARGSRGGLARSIGPEC